MPDFIADTLMLLATALITPVVPGVYTEVRHNQDWCIEEFTGQDIVLAVEQDRLYWSNDIRSVIAVPMRRPGWYEAQWFHSYSKAMYHGYVYAESPGVIQVGYVSRYGGHTMEWQRYRLK